MVKKNLKELGVVEIYPKQNVNQHRFPENVEPAVVPFVLENLLKEERKNSNAIEAYRQALQIYEQPLQAYQFQHDNLAEVISKDITPERTALIIVHMQGILKENNPQISAVEAASKKKIPIYVVLRVQGQPTTWTPEQWNNIPKLSQNLEKAATPIPAENFFCDGSGNGVWASNRNSQLLMSQLCNNSTSTAIVLGQSLGQCVDSTILGRWDHIGNYYQTGLLDLGIRVVTARDVLLPANEVPSSYFNFELVKRPFAVATQPAMPTGQKPGALAAPTNAPLSFANKAVT